MLELTKKSLRSAVMPIWYEYRLRLKWDDKFEYFYMIEISRSVADCVEDPVLDIINFVPNIERAVNRYDNIN